MYVSFPVSTMRKKRLQGAKVQLSTARTLLIFEADILRVLDLPQPARRETVAASRDENACKQQFSFISSAESWLRYLNFKLLSD
jgi:hypothetical protein